MSTCRKAMMALTMMVAVAGAQPGEPGKAGDELRPGGRPGEEPRAKESPGADWRGERERGPRRGQPPSAESFLRAYDQDGDRAVTFEEFREGRKIEAKLSDEGKKRIFDHLDKDGDGRITAGELPRGRGGEGVRPRGQQGFGDPDRDGKISLEEFLASAWWRGSSAEARTEIFKRMDSNGDGFLTEVELRARPEGSRPWERRRPLVDPKVLERLDTNKDGALSFEEWKQSPRFEEIPDERLKEWFDWMDRNHDGKLDPEDRPEGERPGGRGTDQAPPRRGPKRGPEDPPGEAPPPPTRPQ